MSASKLLSKSMSFWVGPRLPSTKTPLLILSSVTWTRRWGHLSASFGSLMRLTRALYFYTIEGESDKDFKCSAFLQRDCARTPQLCGLALLPKTKPIGVQSV